MSPLTPRNGARSRASRPLVVAALIVAMVAPCLAASARGQAAPPTPIKHSDLWYGMYMLGGKIGYQRMTTDPIVYKGNQATRARVDGDIHIRMLGTDVNEVDKEESILDATGRPLTQTMQIRSNGSDMRIDAKFDYAANKVYCTIGSGPSASKKTLDIPPGAVMAADSNFASEGKKMKAGDRMTITFLEPATVTLQQIKVEVKGREEVLDRATGSRVQAWRVEETLMMGTDTSWETDDGDVIRSEMKLGGIGMTMEKESRETALAGSAAGGSASNGTNFNPPKDFAIATSVKVDRSIPNPRACKAIDLTISGIPDRSLVLSDDRQRANQIGSSADGITATYAIRSDTSSSAATSTDAPVTDPDLKPYLDAAPYLNVGDSELKAEALKLRGDEKNLYNIAVRIRNWVNSQMTYDASIGVPRSASDIFRRRRGVCRDYATLFAGLSRAAGVPTRVCCGAVFGEVNGNAGFFYHAWDECWVGKWVAFDPTMYNPQAPTSYVDATHIKFGQGGVTEMFNGANVIGKIKITVATSAH